jgi:hypothetical protein
VAGDVTGELRVGRAPGDRRHKASLPGRIAG